MSAVVDNNAAPVSQSVLEQAMRQRMGSELYDRLHCGRIAIAGLGGLGSHIAVMLARCGIGKLRLIDFDYVDITNINRQAYELDDVGYPKAEALRRKLLRINPYLTVHAHIERVTMDNLHCLFKDEEIICEAFDEPEQKAMLVNGILTTFPAKIVVAASGLAGYGDCNDITTRRILPNLYICGDGVSAVEAGIGLVASRVMVCAGHQANKVIQLLAEI